MTPRNDTQETKPFVLVVDDYADSREMCAEYLGVCGFRVEQAADGAEALSKVASAIPDVILMDLSLPDMDGTEVTRLIKADVRTSGIQIIALTGHGSSGEHADRARQAGCVSFLVKPCHPDAMVDEIRRILAAKGSG